MDWDSDNIPLDPDRQALWPRDQLLRATRSLRVSAISAPSLLGLSDFKGADSCLLSNEFVGSEPTCIPYPAFLWRWASVQSCAWKHAPHKYVLEDVAVFNFVRLLARRHALHGHRLMHVVDSKVVAAVLAKGRSSSGILNRLCQRLTSVILLAGTYVHDLWTISHINYSDRASHRFSHHGAET